MRLLLASLIMAGAAACEAVPQDPPVDPAVLASLDASCDIHMIVEEGTFLPQPSVEDPRRQRANQQLLSACVAAGGNLTALNEWGRSPLGAAAYWGDLASMEQLIAAGASPNLFGPGSYHPVASAVIGFDLGDPEVLALLLAAGGNPNGSARARNDDPQPLATAIWNNDIEVVRMLITAGADITIRDKSNGHTMVERTVLSDDDNGEILTMLFQAGLSPTQPMSRGRTPLEQVLSKGNVGELRALVNAGVDLNAPVGNRPGPLFVLYSTSDITPVFVRELVRLGANPRLTDENGRTAMDRANMIDRELAEVFRQAGLR